MHNPITGLPEDPQLVKTLLSLLDIPSDLVMLLDPTGRIEYANQTFLLRSGLSRTQVVGRSLAEVLPPALAHRRLATVQEVVRSRTELRFEDQGVIGWWDNMVYPILAADEQVDRVAVVARDITDRKEIEHQLKESYTTIQALLNAPTDIVLLLETDGRIVLANQTFANLVHKSPAELVGQLFWDYVPVSVRAARQAFFEQVLHTRQVVRFEDHGIADYLDLVVYPILGANGAVQRIALIARNITRLKETEAALLHSQQKLRASGAELAQRVEARTAELAHANQRLRRAIRHAEVLARAAARLNAQVELRDVAQTICEEARLMSSFACAALHLADEEQDCLTIVAADGQHRERLMQLTPTPRLIYEEFFETANPVIIPNLMRLPPRHDADLAQALAIGTVVIFQLLHAGELLGTLSIYIFGEERDLSLEELRVLQGLVELGTSALAKALHHQHAEESRARLQLLSRRLVEIQESERRYLASELHDEIGQMLSSLNLNLEYVSQAVQSPMSPRSEVLERLSSIRAQVGGLLAQVRNLALDLRPALLDDLGLLPALLDYFERYTCTTHIQVNLKQSGVYGRFATHIETAAFRIIQEALNNVAKHAKAETVDVLLWVEEDRLGVVIKDPGIGFNVQQAARYGATSGLSGMSERAAACGGTLEIDSQPGRGTTLTLEIPLQPYQAGEGG